MRRLLIVAALIAAGLAPASAQDAQPHEVVFARWVRDTFFDGYKPPGPAQRWDVPASANRDHDGIPVNLKAARFGTAVDLGDAVRQFEIDEPFVLIVAFWEQEGDAKRIVNIIAPTVSAEQWRKLWGPVTYADLRRLDAFIKDTAPSVEELRRRALAVKNSPPFTQSIIQVNPKIDDRGQRRLLCSIRSQDLFALLAPGADSGAQEQPTLFGVAYPVPGKPRAANED